MAQYREAHNILESTIEYLETNINNDWSNINIVYAFRDAYKVDLPVVCIALSDFEPEYEEIGSTRIIKKYIIDIDVFCTSHSFRLDMTDYLVDKLKDGYPYKEFDLNSGSRTLTGTAVGRVKIEEWVDNTLVDIGETYHQNDKYRQLISILVKASY